jgi:hypothetical protein
MNRYLMRGVKVYADAATRDAAYGGAGEPTLYEGETVYLADTNRLFTYSGTAWESQSPILRQIVSTTSTTAFTTTSGTYVDVTGLSATITPASTSNRVLVLLNVQGNAGLVNGDALSALQLVRGSTAIAVGAAAGNRWVATGSVTQPEGYNRAEQLDYTVSMAAHVYDSPATTSATTYKVQARVANTGTVAVNRSVTDTDAGGYIRTASSITLIEFAV